MKKVWQRPFVIIVLGLLASWNPMVVQAQKKVGNVVYSQQDAYRFDGESTFTIYAQSTGDYSIKINSIKKDISTEIKVNGLPEEKTSLKDSLSIHLNKGINSITFSEGDNISSITLEKSSDKATFGASVNYSTYQAEEGNTNGVIAKEDRAYRTFASEAAARSYVELSKEGEYVEFTLEESANALVLRYCIPDNNEGTGVDSDLNMYIQESKTSISLTSRYSWVYGAFPWTNDPKDGKGHAFFDDVRIKLDKTYPEGTVIKFQKNKENTAEFYLLDVFETEVIDEPLKMPENALSILDFGAVANDGQDDMDAISDCITEATAQRKEVFIPEGEFSIANPVYAKGIMLTNDNVVIRGAGMWHTVLRGDFAAFYIRADNIAFYDFSLLGNVNQRNDSQPPAFAIESSMKTTQNIRIQNIWMEHWKVGIWAIRSNNIHVLGCRIRNTMADGINLARGCSYSVVEQCDVRNTGDDGIAQWSFAVNDTENTIRFNTVALPWLAQNIAVYGGKDIQITDNLLKDTIAFGSGINISTRFESQLFEGTVLVAQNRLERCGSWEYDINTDYGAIWFNTLEGYDNLAEIVVKDNYISDSTYQGVSFFNTGRIENVLLEDNTIDKCGTYGVEVLRNAKGKAVLKNNSIKNTGKETLKNGSKDEFQLEWIETKKPVLLIAALSGIIIMLITSGYIVYKKKKH